MPVIGNVNMVGEDVTRRGMAIGSEFLEKLHANEPNTVPDGGAAWMYAFALNNSAGQMLFCANAERYPSDPEAQVSAMTGLAAGLVQSLYQVIGERAPGVVLQALENGVNEGWSRCRAIYTPKGSA